MLKTTRSRASAAMLVTGVLSAGTAGAATPFDGAWSVMLVSENGVCTDRYTVPLQVENGRVRYSGTFQAEAQGRIGSNGALSVKFAHAQDVINAKGSIRGDKGFGSWKSPSKHCDGTWTARKG